MMKIINGYLHITKGFKEELIKRYLDKAFLLDKFIDDFIEWGGNVHITNTDAYKTSYNDIYYEDILNHCSCERDFLDNLKFDGTPNYVVWDINDYIHILTRSNDDLKQFKELLCHFVELGGIVYLDCECLIIVDDLKNKMDNYISNN